MELHDSCLKPIGGSTSDSDPTFILRPWDVATLVVLKAIFSINPCDVGGMCTINCMMLPQGCEERVRSLNGRCFAWHPTSELVVDDQFIVIFDDRSITIDTALTTSLPNH